MGELTFGFCCINMENKAYVIDESNSAAAKNKDNNNAGFEYDEPKTAYDVNGKHTSSVLPSGVYPVISQVHIDSSPPQAERGQWSNQFEFILSTIGYAVGLGNIWRFPYLAFQNGGGSFLIPYTIMLFFAGLPLFFMELCLGQYSGQGPTRVFGRLAPAFKGLGYAMLGATGFVAIYYNVIMAWTIFYMFSGFAETLPWSNCTAANSPNCGFDNTSVSPAEDYFNYVMLGKDETITWDNFGSMSWQLVLCLIAGWTIVCLSLIKGVQSSGKVVYFTAIFPFVVLIILFIFGLTLEGASKGIAYYLEPDLDKLSDVKVWKEAATQIFFSLGPTFGGLITLASYNKFDNNCHRDALLVSFLNCGTSVFAGFVVFSFLGYMANFQGKEVKDVVESGPALAFIAYPDALSSMPVPQLWSFLFFFMLLTLGLDSMFTFVETITTAIMDHFPKFAPHKHWVVIGVCVTGFFLGLSMCSAGGIYMFTLIDSTCASWNILLFAIIELILVAWLYGVDNFLDNIREMKIHLPKPVELYWRICWQFVTPILLTVVLVLQFVFAEEVKYGDYTFPPAIQDFGWVIGCASTAFIPGIAAWQYFRRHKKGKNIGLDMFRPSPRWGPAVGASMSLAHLSGVNKA